jgi:F0F1-type ATP synthase membrane subunit b/b'
MISMIINQVMRRVINVGMTKGIDYFTQDKTKKIDENSPEAKQNRKNANQVSKNAKQTLKMARRIGRF